MKLSALAKNKLVVGGVVVVVAGSVAAVLALSVGASPSGHRHAGAAPAAGGPAPATKAAGSSSTTSSEPPPTTSVPDTVAPGVLRSTTSTTTSTTTTTTSPPAPPPCQWAQFTTSVSMAQSAYKTGQPVPFTVVVSNTGPACTDTGQAHCDCWSASAQNSAGQTVWVAGAPSPPTSSDSVGNPPAVIASGWSVTRQMQWDQQDCSTSPTCPGNQVPPGRYQIVGEWAFHVAAQPSSSPPVTFTIGP